MVQRSLANSVVETSRREMESKVLYHKGLETDCID